MAEVNAGTGTSLIKAEQKNEAIVQSGEAKAMIAQYNVLVELAHSVMKEGVDFGIVPGVDKPSLLKPGSEKLRLTFGLKTETKLIREIFDIDKPYLDFTYITSVYNPKTGELMGTCEGNANSYEPKFRYLWVKEDELAADVDKTQFKSKTVAEVQFKWALSRKETTGKYGKPMKYWEEFEKAIRDGRAKLIKKQTAKGPQDAYEIAVTAYRIPNPDVVGLKNTLMKISQKRSFVGAIMLTTGASEFFTQDVEDMERITTEVTAVEAEEVVHTTVIEGQDTGTKFQFDPDSNPVTEAPPPGEKKKGRKKAEPSNFNMDEIDKAISKCEGIEQLIELYNNNYAQFEDKEIKAKFTKAKEKKVDAFYSIIETSMEQAETVERVNELEAMAQKFKYFSPMQATSIIGKAIRIKKKLEVDEDV